MNHGMTKLSLKNERKLLKAFLLAQLYQLFCSSSQGKMSFDTKNMEMEQYFMENKIIQFLIHKILETEEYTLEGIAFYTHIPFDVLYDIACGINKQFSITSWAKVIDLYIQVNPDHAQKLIDRLLEMKQKNLTFISLVLKECD